MCEQAAEAHKSKGVHLLKRTRVNSDSGQLSKSSVDAILISNGAIPPSQVRVALFSILIFVCLHLHIKLENTITLFIINSCPLCPCFQSCAYHGVDRHFNIHTSNP
ncbi:hypothetical protein Dimus_001438 [Dionaea muscipula]